MKAEKPKLQPNQSAEPISESTKETKINENNNSDLNKNTTSKTLMSYLDNDDICAIANISWSFEEKTQALIKATDTIAVNIEKDRLLETLFSEKGALTKTSTTEISVSDEVIVEFFNALLAANLIAGVDSKYINYEKSEQMLLNLSQKDPSNGAYHYFRAAVLKKLGADDETIKTVFLESFKSQYFNTFYNEIAARLFQKSLLNSSYFLIGLTATSAMPITNFTESHRLLISFIKKNDPEFNSLAIDFANKIMGQVPKNGEYEFYHWSALHYILGSKIITQAWPSVFPDKVAPEFKHPRDIQNNPLANKIREEAIHAFESLDSAQGAKNCNRLYLDNLVSKEKKRYLEFLQSL